MKYIVGRQDPKNYKIKIILEKNYVYIHPGEVYQPMYKLSGVGVPPYVQAIWGGVPPYVQAIWGGCTSFTK